MHVPGPPWTASAGSLRPLSSSLQVSVRKSPYRAQRDTRSLFGAEATGILSSHSLGKHFTASLAVAGSPCSLAGEALPVRLERPPPAHPGIPARTPKT